MGRLCTVSVLLRTPDGLSNSASRKSELQDRQVVKLHKTRFDLSQKSLSNEIPSTDILLGVHVT